MLKNRCVLRVSSVGLIQEWQRRRRMYSWNVQRSIRHGLERQLAVLVWIPTLLSVTNVDWIRMLPFIYWSMPLLWLRNWRVEPLQEKFKMFILKWLNRIKYISRMKRLTHWLVRIYRLIQLRASWKAWKWKSLQKQQMIWILKFQFIVLMYSVTWM